MSVVLDLDVGAELADETVERSPFGGAHVRGGDDAEGCVALAEFAQLSLEQAQAVPLHERTEEIYFVGAAQLRLDLGAEARLAVGVGEKGCLAQRSRWATGRTDLFAWTCGRFQAE